MKEKSPAFQWYPKDIQGDPRYRALQQYSGARGAYRDLLDFCWIEGELPLDDKKLALLVGLTRGEWAKIRTQVLALFLVDERKGTIRHKRLDIERKVQELHRAERSISGKKGADKRWENERTRSKEMEADSSTIAKPYDGSAINQPMAKNGSASATATPIPTTSSQPPSYPPKENSLPIPSPEPEKVFPSCPDDDDTPGLYPTSPPRRVAGFSNRPMPRIGELLPAILNRIEKEMQS